MKSNNMNSRFVSTEEFSSKSNPSSPVTVSSLTGAKRRGLIATRDIHPGELLAVDNAIMFQVLQGTHSVKLSKKVRDQHSLSEIDSILEGVAPFYSNSELIAATTRSNVTDSDEEDAYSPPIGGDSFQWSRRALLADSALCQNSFSVRLSNSSLFESPQCRALFCFILYANHSCYPNAEANQVDGLLTSFDDELIYTLTAKRNITMGEEVTISYLPTSWPRSKRRGNLSATYDFDCDCEKCNEEEEEEKEDDKSNEKVDKEDTFILADESAEELRWKQHQNIG